MSTTFADTVAQESRAVTLLGDILTTLGGTVSFNASVSPQARAISLLTSIQDALAESGLPGGVLPGGVTGITFCVRPNGEPLDPAEMTAYIVHGDHVVSFVRDPDHAYAPSLQTPVYVLTLDRAYEPDEVAIFVSPGPYEDLDANVIDTSSTTGARLSGGAIGGIAALPAVWQTGPSKDKTKRLIFPVSINLDEGGVVTWSAGGTDPLCIMLVFFDRTAADIRDPALPATP